MGASVREFVEALQEVERALSKIEWDKTAECYVLREQNEDIEWLRSALESARGCLLHIACTEVQRPQYWWTMPVVHTSGYVQT